MYFPKLQITNYSQEKNIYLCSMKRTLAILMLLIANMIILVHAVVPHHHHDKVAVALAALCEEDDCHQHSHNGSQQHQHDGQEECFLTDALEQTVVKNILDKTLLSDSPVLLLQKFLIFSDFLAIENSYSNNILEYLRCRFRRNDCNTNNYIDFCAETSGFRAPPFC